ncbi:hypothetical protein [Piscinibacter koreensis]|uniref:Uncharacterized protein n=1 Tax=Piscinibacter koreensis TaxID=2742824 RepID=A0A7Y6NKC3_9BURK|nr:hypothetical protein [Schlegelella koreensis]NUZ04676.1 hypothetical protein [Schlegelella koreensis]
MDNLGFTVLRQIPLEHLANIASGLFTVHGGVIRDQGGRIVAHLALPALSGIANTLPGLNVLGGLVQSYQLHEISETVKEVLAISLANTALSGLGLAVSLAGFAYVTHRLNGIDQRIAEVKGWLKSATEGQLKAAVADLGHAARSSESQIRQQLMLSAKTTFTSLAHHYRHQAASAKVLSEIEICEDYSVTAMLGAVMCASDLGLHEAARDDMRAFRAEWAGMARAQIKRLLDLHNAPQLLDGRYATVLPAADLIRVLDFADGEARGLQRIDDLRKGYSGAKAFATGWRTIGDDTIAYARKLRARDDVLASYDEHFGLLAAQRIGASDFARLVAQVTQGGAFRVLMLERPRLAA